MDAFHEARGLLKDAVRSWFPALLNQYPDQTIYAFVLNDHDGTGPSPAANSEELWRAWVNRRGLTGRDSQLLARWAPEEWADWSIKGMDPSPFDRAWSRLIEEKDRWRAEMGLKPDSEEWLDYRARAFATSITALKELADDGFFRSVSSPVTVFFSVSDDLDAVWLERESARRINSPEVFAAFEPEWKIAITQQYGTTTAPTGGVARRIVQFLT